MSPERKQELEELTRVIGSLLSLHKVKLTSTIQIIPMEEITEEKQIEETNQVETPVQPTEPQEENKSETATSL